MATKKKAAGAAAKLSTTDVIKAANKSLIAALAAGDAKAIAGKYTKKAILMATGMPAQKGAKKIQAFWAGAIGMGVKSATLRTTEVDQHGTTAIECGAYSLKGDKGAVLDVGKYIVIWKKEDGSWKLHREIFNTDKAAA